MDAVGNGAEHLVRWSATDPGFSALDQHDLIRQPKGLANGMRNVDDRDICSAFQPFQVRQDHVLALLIQAGQRFVHQQALWFSQQGSSNGDTLSFAP